MAIDMGYSCDKLPDHPVSDLELMQVFRSKVGDSVVNEQVAVFGADQVLASMQQAHKSHLAAVALTPEQLHRRAEMVEALLIELQIPEIGESDEVMTDVERMQMLTRVIRNLADRVVALELHLHDTTSGLTAEEDNEEL